jgi:hypothetical protein
VRTELVLPPAVGNGGNLLDNSFHTLSLMRSGPSELTVSVDPWLNDVRFLVQRQGTWANLIRWGDTGADVRGRVQYDYVRWWHSNPGEVIFQTTPAQIMQGTQILDFDGATMEVTYNPNGTRGRNEVTEPSSTEKVMVKVADEAVEQMKKEGWTPVNPADPGEFGKEVHRRVTVRLQGKKGWLMNVYVEKGTRKILSIGSYPPGVPPQNLTEVDALALKANYRPTVGDVITSSEIEVYDVKNGIRGRLSPTQYDALKAVAGKGPVRVVRPKWVYKNGAFAVASQHARIFKLLSVLGLAWSAYAVINYAEYDDQWERVVEQVNRAKNEADPDQKCLEVAVAVQEVNLYLSNFVPDGTMLKIATVMQIYRILGDWPIDE